MINGSHLLQVRELKTYFFTFEGVAKAVDDVSFYLNKGETLGLVGESGCGKSVTAQSVMRLIPEPPGKIVHGIIDFDSIDLVTLTMDKMRGIRGNRISMIFQEPMTSLNPVYTIGNQISEMFILHEKLSKRNSWEKSIEMLRKVKIPEAEKRVHEYPHQLSGGMRQRAMIAMALSCNPEILIADEPTTALDVTIQAQILELMMQLKEEFEAAIMLITHDLGVIAEIAQRIAVMYAGRIVEEGQTESIFEDPKHPYTRGLLKSIPKLGERARYGRQRLQEVSGIVPSLYELPPGCSFCPRCPESMAMCRDKVPELVDVGGAHRVRCWLY
ncbi:MAG: ABC transporter ATP-binding protein [Deltaproteobacteria bacterium]|nr:ABC transporter ATP-binding protein [Deltaproteobacteria bacterium]MBW2076999.1 ABC transporter ATP-binding protein [Deltaproteobacteria bacterium]MBW2310338.1 ABC transporter ATP-binding protein [Deltaproteobacteria bacterium]